jgi:riboflavin kinase/FMN adenylyltransferase
MKAIVVGEDYTFGKNRKGDIKLLQTYAKNHGFEVIVADWILTLNKSSDRISSTRTRKLVMAGRVAEAQKLLGRHYQIRGVVTTGRNRGGRLLGFPTANIILHDELCPKTGVYAVSGELGSKTHFPWKFISWTLMKIYTTGKSVLTSYNASEMKKNFQIFPNCLNRLKKIL